MRWIVISLVLFNAMFLLWNWVEYRHTKDVRVMNAAAATGQAEMPGAKVVMLRERPAPVQETSAVVGSGMIDGTAAPTVGTVIVPAPVGAPVAVNNADPICLLLGPHPEPQPAKILLDRLGALQIQAKYAAIEVAGEPDYWVYLRPEATKELASVKLRELQEKKIDSFIIPIGEIANGISLGVFDKRENAEKRQQAIIELGYSAQLRENPRNYLENWVVIYPDQSALFSTELYNQLRLDNNKLDLRKDECSKVASQIDIH